VESFNLAIIDFQQWINEREFEEWIQITNAPERAQPLFTIMKHLAETGVSAGVNLRFTGSTIKFDHKWVLITAEKNQ
jgi:hypothetical protein